LRHANAIEKLPMTGEMMNLRAPAPQATSKNVGGIPDKSRENAGSPKATPRKIERCEGRNPTGQRRFID
jgi:hypothetical protein